MVRLNPLVRSLPVLAALGTCAVPGFGALAQEGPQREGTPREGTQRDGTARSGAERKPAPKQTAPKPAPAPAPPAAASPVTDKLRQAGAGACAGQIDALAGGAMADVAQFNTVSSWANTAGDRRAVSVSIGQSYGPGKAVPYGVTSIFAAPSGRSGCDGMAVQVVPSPLPCAKLRETLSAQGRQIGDLAGVPLMQDGGGGQTLLVPTAADTCVLVGLKTAYAP